MRRGGGATGRGGGQQNQCTEEKRRGGHHTYRGFTGVHSNFLVVDLANGGHSKCDVMPPSHGFRPLERRVELQPGKGKQKAPAVVLWRGLVSKLASRQCSILNRKGPHGVILWHTYTQRGEGGRDRYEGRGGGGGEGTCPGESGPPAKSVAPCPRIQPGSRREQLEVARGACVQPRLRARMQRTQRGPGAGPKTKPIKRSKPLASRPQSIDSHLLLFCLFGSLLPRRHR
jgi:hypothetical protein